MENSAVYTLIISSKAQKEMVAAWQWYEEREEGLGDRLYTSIKQKLNIIEINPEVFSLKERVYREATIPIFPFVIVYKIYKRKKLIEIVSIFHTSRNPKGKY